MLPFSEKNLELGSVHNNFVAGVPIMPLEQLVPGTQQQPASIQQQLEQQRQQLQAQLALQQQLQHEMQQQLKLKQEHEQLKQQLKAHQAHVALQQKQLQQTDVSTAVSEQKKIVTIFTGFPPVREKSENFRIG